MLDTRISPTLCLTFGLLLTGCRLPGVTPRNVLASRTATERGVRALEQGQWLQAETELAQAVKACDTEVDARRYYAEALWRRGALPEAWDQLEAATELAPDNAQLWIRCGQLRLAMNEPQRAWALAETALELDPHAAEPWILRGQTLRCLGRNQDALSDFLRALHYAPGNRAALDELAAVYLALGEPARALGALQALADTYPPGEEPVGVLDKSAEVLASMGRYDDAVDQWSASLARVRPTPDRAHAYAEALWRAGRVSEARAATLRTLALAPDHAAGRELLSRLGARDATSEAVTWR